jgi:hypothetical protein
MPQDGQGLSNQIAQAQGSSPSWVCDPCPAPSGEIHAAVDKTASDMRENAAAPSRDPVDARNGVVRSGRDWACMAVDIPIGLSIRTGSGSDPGSVHLIQSNLNTPLRYPYTYATRVVKRKKKMRSSQIVLASDLGSKLVNVCAHG